MRIVASVFALVLLGAAPPAFPSLDMPAGWTQNLNSASASGVNQAWANTEHPGEKWSGLVQYTVVYKGSYADAVTTWRDLVSCKSGDTGDLLKQLKICGGIVVDREEQCNGHAAHRIVRIANLGPPMLFAQTLYYISWGEGFLQIRYERQASKYTPDHPDGVVTALQSLCETLPSPAPSPVARDALSRSGNRRESSR